MARIISKIDITLPEIITGIDERNFWTRHCWKRDESEIKRRIIDKFEEGLLSACPYSDENIPREVVKSSIKIDGRNNIEFLVTTTPKVNHPSYQQIYLSFSNYLKVLLEQYTRGIQRRGVITVNDESYILVLDLSTRLKRDVKRIRSSSFGVSQAIEPVSPLELLSRSSPSLISIAFDRDYSKLTEYNAEIYIMAEKFIELGKKRASGFEEMLFAESLKTLGVQRPETVASLAYPFENITITHQLEPRTSSKYAEIVGAFISPAPAKVIRVDSKIGDLIKVNMFLDEDSFENLRNKGLVDNKFMDSYKPIIREGKVYINP